MTLDYYLLVVGFLVVVTLLMRLLWWLVTRPLAGPPKGYRGHVPPYTFGFCEKTAYGCKPCRSQCKECAQGGNE
jgi:hypothetical protein